MKDARIKKLTVGSIADSVKAGGEVKTYTWYHKKNTALLAALSTTVIVKRESSNTTIDGKKGSIWNVRTFTQARVLSLSFDVPDCKSLEPQFIAGDSAFRRLDMSEKRGWLSGNTVFGRRSWLTIRQLYPICRAIWNGTLGRIFRHLPG